MGFIDRVMAEFFLLLKAPLIVPEMWWIVIPLIVILLLMTFYFGRYIRERLGWNTAIANSVVLFFVGMDLLRTVYNYSEPATSYQFVWNPIKTTIIIAIMIEGLLLTYSAFSHALPKKVMFFIASPLPVNLQAYVIIAVVYLQILPTVYTLYAAILLFIVLFAILRILQEFEHFHFGHPETTVKKR